MNEIIVSDDKLLHFNTGHRDSNTESSLIYQKDGELHTIVLNQCAKNYRFLHAGTSDCVAERNTAEFTITFYTSGLLTKIVFKKRFYLNLWQNKLLRGNRTKRFQRLTDLIYKCGFTVKENEAALPRDEKFCSDLDLLLTDQNYDDIISKITALYGNGQIPLETEKKLALAYFHKQDFDNSLEHFESIAAKKETTENLFNVMTSLLSLGKIEQARDIFNRIIQTHRGTGKGKNFLPQLCIPYIRYYYACGLVDAEFFDEALIHLEELKKIFIGVKITDDTFLYMRGIPFFADFIKLAQRVFIGLKTDFKSSAFLEELLSVVDQDGKEVIKAIIEKQ